MTPEQLKENIEDGLIRLKRDYVICYQGYDRAALKSLAHSLRLWVDMHAHVESYLAEHLPSAKFNSYSVTPLFNRTFRDREYMLMCFPKRVALRVRRPTPEEVAAGVPSHVTISNISVPTPAMILAPGQEINFECGFDYQNVKGQEECTIGRFIVVSDRLAQRPSASQDRYIIDEQAFDYKRVKFSGWMSGLAARLMMPDNETGTLCRYDISREELIKRIANVLGGSHPQGGHVITNDKDFIVSQLMLYKAMHLPAPYMVLMKIAQDILDVFDV
jgi:hypothetical protein